MIQVDNNEIIVVAAIKSTATSYQGAIPVIVSSVLERHSLLIDTIVMVHKDQLPKKHNGEKLRKKVLSMYRRKEMYCILCKQQTDSFNTNISFTYHIDLQFMLVESRISIRQSHCPNGATSTMHLLRAWSM